MSSEHHRQGLCGPGRAPASGPDAQRRRSLHALLALASGVAAGVGLPGCASAPAAPSAAGFDAWSDAFVADWMRLSPEYATIAQYFSGAEQAALDRQLSPHTPERRDARLRLARQGLQQLAGMQTDLLTPDQRTGASILRWSLAQHVASEPYQDHAFGFNQLRGWHVLLLNFLTEWHPLRRPDDLDAYLGRLGQLATRLDEAMAQSRAAMARGLLPPRVIVERARTQVQGMLALPPARSDLVTALQRRTEHLSTVTAAQREQALTTATRLLEQQVLPAYQRVLALLDDALPRATAEVGLWRLPDGDGAYAQALAAHTTSSLGAEEIHQIGLREVARIEAEMDAVLRSLGHTQGAVKDRVEALRLATSPPPDPDPRPALLERYSAAVRDAQRRAQALFNLQPLAPLEVRRVPALTERTSSAYYTTPAPDGSQPGVFWVPMPGPTYNVLGLRSLAVHEAVPGHHFQLALQQEQTALPRWRQRLIFGGGSAHTEGWALYAERLALDNGWYEGDPQSLVGALDSQLFRARRLVVDTGLHAKRWTREQAIDYGIGAREVERYIAMPGQATAYMVGMLHILALRDEARSALGTRFDIKAFHDVVLRTGSVPLEVLGEVLRRGRLPA